MFFLVLFLTSDGGWGFICNEKDNTWITSFFKFHPREDPNMRFLDTGAFSCIRNVIRSHRGFDSLMRESWE